MIKNVFFLFKRVSDFIAALLLVLILSPLLILVSIVIYVKTNDSPFFIQKRVGKDERIFSLMKFKTMNDKKDSFGTLLSDGERLTSIGMILRKYSLDELPQLLNVLKGDMSLIGPRPLLVRYLSRYSDEQRRRHEVWPGITGLAQVNGRNALSWERKFEFDIQYIDNISFSMDLRILWQTIIKVLKREGISSRNSDTMEEFFG